MTNPAFLDLPVRAYPVMVEIFEIGQDITRAQPVWHTVITSPGVAKVPGFGRPMRTRVKYGDGTVVIEPPLTEEIWI